MKQIFVRGMSRSGGTLIVTVLDAHPDVAMCYETYEHLLAPLDDGQDRLPELRAAFAKAKPWWKLSSGDVIPQIDDRPLNTFIKWALRGGIKPRDLHALIKRHAAAGLTFSTFNERMRLVEAIGLEKMHREGKRHWGTKMIKNYHEVHTIFPEAYFLFMKRDGRDIAASRKLVGNFNQPMERVANGWCRQSRKFLDFAATPGVRTRMVDYERLATEPEAELREIISFLGLPWDDRVLSFHEKDLTIYRTPMGHLSANQVNKPINTSSVGRWKRDLTAEEIAEFEAVAGPMLTELGYEISQPHAIGLSLDSTS